jgi:diguanylate cyclase (GGDEF)-like protein
LAPLPPHPKHILFKPTTPLADNFVAMAQTSERPPMTPAVPVSYVAAFRQSVGHLRQLIDTTFAGIATHGLVIVLLVLSTFAIWSSVSTSRLGQQAIASTLLSNHYASAAAAVAAEESLERKFRLEPSPNIRQRYQSAAADLITALENVRRAGAPEDEAIVGQVLTAHQPYLQAIERMFAAVERGDSAETLRIDAEEVDPRFEVIEKIVDRAAEDHHRSALAALVALRDREAFNARVTPLVFIAGLVLVALFSNVLYRTRAQLDQQRKQAVHESLHDALTGLPNRTLLNDRFELALRGSRRNGTGVGLLLVDLDRFKDVNDTLGHHYGDQLLVQVGRRIASVLRDCDTIARLGGDEFAVVLPGVEGLDAAFATAHRIHAAMLQPFLLQEVEIDAEASIGVALSGIHGEDTVTLLQRADIAMYSAKHNGAGVCAYDVAADPHSTERLSLLGQLRRAIERGELFLHYQPKVDLHSGALTGVEALVRWNHPERGLLPPGEFIPLAEHTGLIAPLTLNVLDMAIGQMRAWSDSGQPIPVSVNISARNLLDAKIADHIVALLDKHGVPPSLLALEITESAMMLEPQRARRLLDRMHELGVRLALDDFGAGYTSLAQLRDLPINELKIDRSFITALTAKAENSLIVRSIVDLGHNLGMHVVAEGIEDAATGAALNSFGCDMGQGYHLCRPTCAAEIQRWRAQRSTPATASADATVNSTATTTSPQP